MTDESEGKSDKKRAKSLLSLVVGSENVSEFHTDAMILWMPPQIWTPVFLFWVLHTWISKPGVICHIGKLLWPCSCTKFPNTCWVSVWQRRLIPRRRANTGNYFPGDSLVCNLIFCILISSSNPESFLKGARTVNRYSLPHAHKPEESSLFLLKQPNKLKKKKKSFC